MQQITPKRMQLLKENKKLKLHLRQSLLIKHDNPELNKNIYGYPLELFD